MNMQAPTQSSAPQKYAYVLQYSATNWTERYKSQWEGKILHVFWSSNRAAATAKAEDFIHQLWERAHGGRPIPKDQCPRADHRTGAGMPVWLSRIQVTMNDYSEGIAGRFWLRECRATDLDE
jgi:hypothetical protein